MLIRLTLLLAAVLCPLMASAWTQRELTPNSGTAAASYSYTSASVGAVSSGGAAAVSGFLPIPLNVSRCDVMTVRPDPNTGAEIIPWNCPTSTYSSAQCEALYPDSDGDGLRNDGVTLDGITIGRTRQHDRATFLFVAVPTLPAGTASIYAECH